MYLVLKNLIEHNKKRVGKYVPDLTTEYSNELAIFLNENRFKEINSLNQFKDKLKTTPDYFHATKNIVDELSRSLSRKCDAISERTEVDQEI